MLERHGRKHLVVAWQGIGNIYKGAIDDCRQKSVKDLV